MSQMKSSLALQIILNLAFTYSSIYFILMFLIFLYKVIMLTYPIYIKAIEGMLIIEILPLEMLKTSWAKRGNLTETWAYLSLSMLLNLLMGLICVYIMFFQAFVVALELYLTVIQICFVLILLILHLITIILFVKCCVLEYIKLYFHQEKMSSEIVEDVLQIFDCKIGYCKYGSGKTNILMIPGGVGCYKKDFPESVLVQFDPSLVTIVCIDPPGYGTSRPPDRKQSINRCQLDAKYCLELMKILKLEPFNAVGWSEGARTAIHVGGQGKELVQHLVLIAASTKVDQRGAMVFRGMRNTNQWLPNAREVYLQHYSEDFIREQWASLCDLVYEVYEMLGGVFLSHNVLPQLQCPVLLMNGGQDRFIMDSKIISDKLKNCEVLVHAQANHDIHIKYPKWFAQNVYKFITKEGDSPK